MREGETMKIRKNDLFFLILFVLIAGVSLIYLAQASYAKYRKQAESHVDVSVASWNIKINNESIQNKTVLENAIIPVFDSDPYIKEGVLAPGTTGYFDLVINAEDVDVDFTYEISCSVHEETPLLDLIITEYELNGVKTPYLHSTKITGEIEKSSEDTSIRIYFKWDDDPSTQNMDNYDDTEYTIQSNGQSTKIKASIQFAQKNSN